MRDREEIEKEFIDEPGHHTALFMEVLLDIRELLKPPAPVVIDKLDMREFEELVSLRSQQTQWCSWCKGTGTDTNPQGRKVLCGSCGGKGRQNKDG